MKSKHKNQRNRKGKRGKGWLTSPSCTPVRGEKKGPAGGAQLAGIRPQGRRGQAARRRRAHPLGSAHAGEGAGDGAGARCSHSPLESLGAAFAALRKESGEDREWRRPNGARVQGRRSGRRFCSCDARGWPSDRRERLRSNGPTRGLGGRADARALPAQARVAAWVRPARACSDGPSRFCRFLGRFALLWAEMAEHSEIEFILFFPETDLIHI